TIESAKAAFQITYHDQIGVQWEERKTTVSEHFTYEIKTYEAFEEVEEVEEIVEDYEVSEVVAQEKAVTEDERLISTHQSITSSHDDTIVLNFSEQVLFEEGATVDDSAKLSRNQYETLTHVDSSTTATSTAAPLLSLSKCKISGIPASLGDLTIESLVFEMRDAPIFDDESLGAMDLEEEQDILQFLVEQVHEDIDYTKLLLWTVYKSVTEGIINQSTKNAAYILEKSGIQFQPQL
ncbi:hypothetical protein BGZ96_002076, partial [Linnemannia gamsii]